MDLKFGHSAHRRRDKWPNAAPEIGCSPRESTSSSSGASVLELVRKISRTCSSRTSSIIHRVGWRSGKRMAWQAGSLNGDGTSSTQDTASPVCENIPVADIDPLLGARGLRSSIRFSSYPSRPGTSRSRRVGDVFQSCRNRLSKNSLRESIDHMLDRDGGSAAYYIALSSEAPPRLDVLRDLDPAAPKDDGFWRSLEEAMQDITARCELDGYVNEAGPKLTSRISKTMPARAKTADFRWATEALKGVIAEESWDQHQGTAKVAHEKDDIDSKGPSADKIGEAAKAKLKVGACIRKAPGARKGIPQLSDNEPSRSSRPTGRLVEDLGIKADVSRSHSIRNTVKLIYPWFQKTKGRLEVCPSHEAAMNKLQTTQLSLPVHDLAFYDAASRSYILLPTCFLVDREVVDVAQERGINLISLGRRRQALRGDAGAEDLRPGELAMGAASVKMEYDEDYVVVSIHRTYANEVPVFIEADGEEQTSIELELDGDAADEKRKP